MKGEFAGPYRIDRQIGVGGMGTVYAAEHELLGRKAAVKVLLPEMTAKPDMVRRFLNEARAVAAIRHDNIVKIYDLGTTASGQVFIAMELLEGETLAARRSRAPVPQALTLTLVRQIAAALGAAHQADVVHRDLKPDNVFLARADDGGETPTIKLLDFGVAKLMWPDHLAPTTRTGTIIGTPTYMAPEQCRGVGVDHRADLYALGCILFELLCGRPPFRGEGMGDVLTAHIHVPAPSVRSIVPTVPAPIDALVERLLAKKPSDRPATAQRVIEHLDAITAGLVRKRRPRRPTDQVATLPHLPVVRDDAAAVSSPVPEVIEDHPTAGPPPSSPSAITLPALAPEPHLTSAPPAAQRDYPSTLSRASQVRAVPPAPRTRWRVAAAVAAGASAVAVAVAVAAVVSAGGHGQGDSSVAIITPVLDAGTPTDAPALPIEVNADPEIAMEEDRINLVVRSMPRGASVLVGGDRVGRTQLATTIGRRSGAVVVTIVLAGYEARTFSRAADRDISIDVMLVPTSVSTPLPLEESGAVLLRREAEMLKFADPSTAYEKLKVAYQLDPDVEQQDDLGEYALRANDRKGAKEHFTQYLLNRPSGTAAELARRRLGRIDGAPPLDPSRGPTGFERPGPPILPPVP